MSNNKDFKVKAGIQPTSYFEGVGTVVSGSEGYNLGVASYDNVSFSVASQVPNPINNTFSSDGTKTYVIDGSSGIFQYNLATAWDLSTASYASKSFLPTSQIPSGYNYGITFKSDGTKVYLGDLVNAVIYQYSLSTAWDISTTSYDSVSLNVASQASAPFGIFLSSDNTQLYIAAVGNDRVVQYTLSTAGVLSSASHTGNFSVASQDANPRAVYLKSDGTKAFIVGNDNSSVFSYTLSIAWDITSAAYDNVSFSTLNQEADIRGLYFSNTGHSMFVLGHDPDTIYQYSTALNTATLDLSTGSVFEVTPTSDIQVTLSNPADSGTVSGATLLLDGGFTAYDLANSSYDSKSFNVSTQESNARGSYFKSDGTKLYVVGTSSGTVYQYSLSTAWNVSTASYDSKSFSVSSQETAPQALYFKDDGTILFVVGSANGTVFQYDLSTAWDISTASYSSVSYDASTQDVTMIGLSFKSDGTRMYLGGTGTEKVYQYSLSTAWDVSTASYDSKSLSYPVTGIALDNTGQSMFLATNNPPDKVSLYTMTTAWDVSTATLTADFDVSSQALGANDIALSSSFDKMYITDSAAPSTVFQYTIGTTPATITYDTAIEWPSGTAPTSPAIGETDVVTFNTRDGGSTYQGVLAIDGAK